MTRALGPLAGTALLAATLASCGASTEPDVLAGAQSVTSAGVVHVGRVGIGRSEISHWAAIAEKGSVLPGPEGRKSENAEERALRFLIWSAWVSGDTAERGSEVSNARVARAISAERAGFPSEAEFEQSLRANGESIADAKLQIATALAGAAVERRALVAERAVTHAEIVAYYERHKHEFTKDEERQFEIVNYLPYGKARRTVRRSRIAHVFPARALHESLTREHMLHTTPEKRAIERAIFAAKQDVPDGPVKLYKGFSIFVVRHIVPSTLTPLGAVQAEIEARLAGEQRRRAFAHFAQSWVAKWKEKTSCDAGYVIDMCRQSSVVPKLEEALGKALESAEAAVGSR